MNKTELLAEMTRLGMNPNPSWTVTELRSLMVEMKEAEKRTALVPYNTKTPKGILLRQIRDYHDTPSETVMTIGRHRGNTYSQVPRSYAEWACKEDPSNMHPDLQRFVTWYRRQQDPERRQHVPRAVQMQNPDKYAKNPPPPPSDAGTTGTSHSWEEVAVLDHDQRPMPPSTRSTRHKDDQIASKRRAETGASTNRMAMDPDPKVMEEIQELEGKLAALKDNGLPRHQAVADNALLPAEAAKQIFPKLNGEPVLECATPTSGEFQSGNIEADPATPANVVADHWEYNYQLGVLVRFHYQSEPSLCAGRRPCPGLPCGDLRAPGHQDDGVALHRSAARWRYSKSPSRRLEIYLEDPM